MFPHSQGNSQQVESIQATVLTAPVLGVQSNKSFMAMDPQECIYAYNILPKEYGLEVRSGYRYFADIPTNAEVRTIMSFYDGTASKTFAATVNGIYDITAGGAAGALVYTWPTPSGDAGFCSYHYMTNAAGNHLLVCDEVNGYVRYSVGGGWVLGGVTGAGMTNDQLCFVTEFKERLWFVQKNTGRAWYLPVNAITGAAAKFEFGGKFSRGGNLRALYVWTVDGGRGVDDYLIVLGDQGDIIAYRGIDPVDPTDFQSTGNWYVGFLPKGRRIGSNFGGEFILLCGGGLVSVTKLMRGGQIGEETVYLTANVARLVRAAISAYGGLNGWDITMNASANEVIVSTPETEFNLQFVMNITTQAWGMTRDVPALCQEVVDGQLVMGDRAGNIWKAVGTLDAADVAGNNGVPIEWSMLQSYQTYGAPGKNHMMQSVRPLFISNGVPSYAIQARYDFNLDGIMASLSTPTASGSLWNFANWDLAIWGSGDTVIYGLAGTKGIGRQMAIALKGQSSSVVQYAGADVLWRTGGYL